MQTLKTALVVVALLAAFYVAHQALNQQPIALPWNAGDVAGAFPDDAEGGAAEVQVEAPAFAAFGSSPPAAGESSSLAPAAANAPFAISSPPPALATAFPGGSPPAMSASDQAAGAGQVAQGGAIASEARADEFPATASLASANVAAATAPLAQTAIEATFDVVDPAPNGSASAASSASAAPSSSNAAPPARYSSPALAKYAFEQAWRKAELHIGDGQLARALLALTPFYRHPDLDDATQQKLHERLDQLAGTVIYSTRHLLEEPYKAQRGETLEEIAQRYKVPTQLLQNINGVNDASLLLPGTELKVLRGPFRAEIDTARGELTLFLGSLYAGRFAIRAGNDPVPQPGQYEVRDIQPGHTYYSPTGQMIAAGNPANPYGARWIDLGRDVSIHGSPASGSATAGGCLSLSPRDAADVAAILAVGSPVVIR